MPPISMLRGMLAMQTRACRRSSDKSNRGSTPCNIEMGGRGAKPPTALTFCMYFPAIFSHPWTPENRDYIYFRCARSDLGCEDLGDFPDPPPEYVAAFRKQLSELEIAATSAIPLITIFTRSCSPNSYHCLLHALPSILHCMLPAFRCPRWPVFCLTRQVCIWCVLRACCSGAVFDHNCCYAPYGFFLWVVLWGVSVVFIAFGSRKRSRTGGP